MSLLSTIRFQPLLEGMLTFLPGCSRILARTTGGADSARYCYAVWMRHDVKTRPYRRNKFFHTIVELGPGDSLGVGLAALLAGSRNYIALDAVEYADPERDGKILNELADLFSDRSPIPSEKEFPEMRPNLDHYGFPKWLSDSCLPQYDKVIDNISDALANINTEKSPITYQSPDSAENIPGNSVDFICSQAVLEHVDNLDQLYKDCFKWLVPGGLMAHGIDFRSHGTVAIWNGHWVYPSILWRIMRGRRPYLINREPFSAHLELMRGAGFEIVMLERFRMDTAIIKGELAKEYSHFRLGRMSGRINPNPLFCCPPVGQSAKK